MFQLPKPPKVVQAALDKAANATLNFSVAIVGGTVTDDFGNVFPATEAISFRATVIRPSSKSEKNTTVLTEGIDEKWIVCDARLVNPKSIEGSGVGNLSEGTIVFDDGATGTIKLKVDTQSPYPGVRERIGDRLLIYLKLDRPV